MWYIIGILLIACVVYYAIQALAPENWIKRAALVVLGCGVALWLIAKVFGVSLGAFR